MTVSVAVFPNSRIPKMTLYGIDPAGVPMVVKAAPAQTAGLQEWQDNAGLTLASISAAGRATVNSLVATSGGASILLIAGSSNSIWWGPSGIGPPAPGGSAGSKLTFYPMDAGNVDFSIGIDNSTLWYAVPALSAHKWYDGTTLVGQLSYGGLTLIGWNPPTVGLVVKGAAAQTADLQQWQDSAGSALSYIQSTGRFIGPQVYASGGLGGSGVGPGATAVPSSAFTIIPGATSISPLVLRGAASQSANLQQWQNSAGTVLGRVTAGGVLGINSIQDAGTSGPFFTMAPTTVTLTSTQIGTNPTYVVKAIASQAGDLQQWQDDLGNAVAKMSPTGVLSALHITKLGVSTTYLNLNANVAVLGQTAANIGLIIRGAASQTGDLQQWQDSGAVPLARVSKGGYFTTAKTAAPADADVNTSEVQQWWNNTIGSTHVVFKGKDSSGSVVSYAPSRLLAVAKYTAVGPSAVRGAASSVGMVVSFTMPALQAGQRVRLEGTAYYYNFASTVAAHALYNFIYVNDAIQVAARFDWTSAVQSQSQRFEAVWGYIDNTEVAAGTWVNAGLWSLSTSGVAFQYVNPAHMAATIV